MFGKATPLLDFYFYFNVSTCLKSIFTVIVSVTKKRSYCNKTNIYSHCMMILLSKFAPRHPFLDSRVRAERGQRKIAF